MAPAAPLQAQAELREGRSLGHTALLTMLPSARFLSWQTGRDLSFISLTSCLLLVSR